MIPPFENYQLHHVGIILPSLDQAETFMQSMGFTESYRGFVTEWSCWCIFVKGNQGAAIELVVAEDGPLKRFNKGAGGVHHFAFQVDDIVAKSRELEERGFKMLEKNPIKGAGDFLCNFINPVTTRGIMMELVQPL